MKRHSLVATAPHHQSNASKARLTGEVSVGLVSPTRLVISPVTHMPSAGTVELHLLRENETMDLDNSDRATPLRSKDVSPALQPSESTAHDDLNLSIPQPIKYLTQAAREFLDSVPIQLSEPSESGIFNGPFHLSGSQPPGVAPKDMCAIQGTPADLKAALASVHTGESALHRVYEVAMQTPQGTILPKDFVSTYGPDAAKKLQPYNITQVVKSGKHTDVDLQAPINATDGSASLSIAKDLSFDSAANGTNIDLTRVKGVTASNGWLSAYVNSAELRPLENGYMSATIKASLSPGVSFPSFAFISRTVELCAHPDGKIYQ